MFHTFEMLPPRLCDFLPGPKYATSVSLPLLGRSFGTMTRLEQQTSERLRLVFCADRKLLVVTCSHGDVYRDGLYDIDNCLIVAMFLMESTAHSTGTR
jgi:hypothetical protein